LKDSFGKTPLHYALESKDKLVLSAVITGILNMEKEERIAAMLNLPIDLLVKEFTPDLPCLLREAGKMVPVQQVFG